jgi:hypothetical protein
MEKRFEAFYLPEALLRRSRWRDDLRVVRVWNSPHGGGFRVVRRSIPDHAEAVPPFSESQIKQLEIFIRNCPLEWRAAE